MTSILTAIKSFMTVLGAIGACMVITLVLEVQRFTSMERIPCSTEKINILTDHEQENLTRDREKLKTICPLVPPALAGPLFVNKSAPRWDELNTFSGHVTRGGRFIPHNCTARNKVAIVVPYRDREKQLKTFLRHIHPFLQRQLLDYRIFVVEQTWSAPFNRGMVKNIGVSIASKMYDYDCFIFHDVDFLPVDDRNMYACSHMPHHLAVAVEDNVTKGQYNTKYETYIGGVLALTKEQFESVNGYPNTFFCWCGEDDELRRRILRKHMNITRNMDDVARYVTLDHIRSPVNHRMREKLRESSMDTDGIKSLRYQRVKMELRQLYTWILVEINEAEVMQRKPFHNSNIGERKSRNENTSNSLKENKKKKNIQQK